MKNFYIGDVIIVPRSITTTTWRARNMRPRIYPLLWVIVHKSERMIYSRYRSELKTIYTITILTKTGIPSKNHRNFKSLTANQISSIKIHEKQPRIYRCPDCGLDDNYSLLEAPLKYLDKIHDYNYYRCMMCKEQYISWIANKKIQFSMPAYPI